jgi:hypothetical protein
MPARIFPPRLHVLLARDAPRSLVLRRGPSKTVCAIGWDRRNDTFTVGQWMRGRIYERRSDLSPDGRHLIYFAMNGRWETKVRGAWTAVSRAPYLKALALFAKGDCWHGGGLFLDERRYWLNDGAGHTPLITSSRISRHPKWQPPAYYGGECLTVYYNRLQRDGWTPRDDPPPSCPGDPPEIFDKPAPTGWTLRKYCFAEIGAPEGRGVYHDRHALVRADSGDTLYLPDWEWADLDGKRLVWTAHGKLHAAKLCRSGLREERVLHDFNAMSFTAIAAPY